MSSSGFLGLDEDWWKEKALAIGSIEASTAIGGIEASTARVTVVGTRSKSKPVHWE